MRNVYNIILPPSGLQQFILYLCQQQMLSFFCFWPLNCLSFDLQLRNTPLVSSNVSLCTHISLLVNFIPQSLHLLYTKLGICDFIQYNLLCFLIHRHCRKQQDKHIIPMSSVKIKLITTHCETGKENSAKARFSTCFLSSNMYTFDILMY